MVFLDRQRFVSSLKAEQLFGDYANGGMGMKVKLYSEFHALPSGTLHYDQPSADVDLPDDYGWLVGAQFGIWNFMPRSFVNVFARYAGGLAAYGEGAIPWGVNDDKAIHRCHEPALRALFKYRDRRLWGSWPEPRCATLSTPMTQSKTTTTAGRAHGRCGRLYLGMDYYTPGLEVSQQFRRPNGLSPNTLKQETAQIWKFSFFPVALTFGEGMYARPQLRVNYTLSLLNEAARMTYPEEDALRDAEVEHYLGLAFEWWFNSTSYQ